MLSAELVSRGRIEVRECAQASDPGPGEVMVKLRAVGLCGSDLHWFQDGGIGHSPAVYPMVLGHEPVGEVVAVGRGLAAHKLGDLVAIEPSVTCGHCEYCRAGFPNNCTSCVFMGGPHSPGFFREFATVPARNAEIVPEGIDYLTAALIEPTAVLVHVLELAPVRVGDTVAVLGAGPIGLLAALMARASGASKVFLADRVAHRLELGRKAGCAGFFVHMPGERIDEAVFDHTRGRGVDVVYDAAGAAETIDAGIRIARPGGHYVLIGIPVEKGLNWDIHTAMMKELRIQTVKRSNHKGHQAMELVRAGFVPASLITHPMSLDRTQEAFELVSGYRDGVGKLVIEMKGP